MKVEDDRFNSILRDHRFRPIRQRQRKIQIDRRFHSMFSDKRFKVTFNQDKRGRPIKQTSAENLKRYYQLSHEEKKRIKQERIKKRNALARKLDNEDHKATKENVTDTVVAEENEDSSDISSSESDESENDLARGKGNMESSSSDDDSEVEEFEDSVTSEHKWGEFDAEAPRSEDTSRRLALCNMDWDRIKLKDVMVVMNSFKPAHGSILKISLYLSDFGAERLKDEEAFGPAELREGAPTGSNAIPLGQPTPDEKFEERFQTEKLREYQINRLKYYFIVIECDSVKTAEQLYNECDNREFETSCSRMDLRFIPDDVSFEDRTPKEVITEIPDLDSYKPSDFTTSALNQTKVELTWDETDYERTKLTMRKFNKEDLEDMDVKDFLASSSGSDNERDLKADQNDNIEVKKFANEEERLQHYRNLLLGETENDSEKDDIDMEVTWEPNLMKKGEDTKSSSEEEESSGNESDDESEEIEEQTKPEPTRKKKTKGKGRKHIEEDELTDKQKADLEMIMMDDIDIDEKNAHKHFSMDDIIEQEKLKNKKKRRKNKKEETEVQDDFQIDVDDKRFSALYNSSRYNIDRSNPKYRKSQGMETLVRERQKRIQNTSANDSYNEKADPQVVHEAKSKPMKTDDVTTLIKSIKAKTNKFKQPKKRTNKN